MKSITFITTGQPTTNPRLVKEAETLINHGYNVKVICCFYQLWAQKFDAEITAKNPGMYIFCGGDPVTQKALYFKTRVRQKLCQLFCKFVKTGGVAENAISRTHAESLSIAKKIKTDIYIAHNLGALPAAVMAAKYTGAKVGYDAEDMHSGQFTSDKDESYLLNKYIEEKYFPQINYFSAASPLIAEYYKKAYPFLEPVVINNVFPKTNLTIKKNYKEGGPLKLFWFSQTIGPDRGLETVIAAIAKIGGQVELHLLGACSPNNKSALVTLAKEQGLSNRQLQFHEPVAADSLFSFAAQFDIGIASETASTLNRDICLTNKIFTYLQCGLAIIASDTKSQSLFMRQYPETGKLYPINNTQSLADCINFYAVDPGLLYQTRLQNYNLGQMELNWEIEGKIFLLVIKRTFQEND